MERMAAEECPGQWRVSRETIVWSVACGGIGLLALGCLSTVVVAVAGRTWAWLGARVLQRLHKRMCRVKDRQCPPAKLQAP